MADTVDQARVLLHEPIAAAILDVRLPIRGENGS